jgi:hypothetical protein
LEFPSAALLARPQAVLLRVIAVALARPVDGAVAALLGGIPGPAAHTSDEEALMGCGIAEAAGAISVVCAAARRRGSGDGTRAVYARESSLAGVARAANLARSATRSADTVIADQIAGVAPIRRHTADLKFSATRYAGGAVAGEISGVAGVACAADFTIATAGRHADVALVTDEVATAVVTRLAARLVYAAAGRHTDVTGITDQIAIAVVTRLAARLVYAAAGDARTAVADTLRTDVTCAARLVNRAAVLTRTADADPSTAAGIAGAARLIGATAGDARIGLRIADTLRTDVARAAGIADRAAVLARTADADSRTVADVAGTTVFAGTTTVRSGRDTGAVDADERSIAFEPRTAEFRGITTRRTHGGVYGAVAHKTGATLLATALTDVAYSAARLSL